MESRSPGVGRPAAPDDRLASAILGGTELALFENAYAAYAGEAHHTALGFLGDPQLALDAVHNAFLEILRRLLNGARWSDAAEARAVVLRNTRWAALNILRTRRRRREAGVAEDTPGTDDGADWARSEARDLCDQILLQLRPQHQRALRLHFADGLSNPEAASRLGMATSAYESLLRRAISAARRAARKSGFLPGLAWWPVVCPKRQPRFARRVAHVASSSAAMVAQAGAVALLAAVAANAAGLDRESEHPLMAAARGPAVSTSSLRVGADGEQVGDIVVSDAVAIDSPTTTGTVLAVGRGRACACWVVARTTDAGGHWTVTAGPDTAYPALHLALSSAYPRDPRIAAVSTPGVEQSTWVSASYGASFQPMAAADELHAGAYPHATRCAGTTAGVRCAGRFVAPPGGGAGTVLATATHLLYFPDSGSVLCSANAGRTWRPSCGSS